VGPYLPFDANAKDERNREWWSTRPSNEWLALCRRNGISDLVRTKMNVSPVQVDGDRNGLLVSAPACPDALVLMHGLSVNPGEVPTATVIKKTAPSPRRQDTIWTMTLHGRTWRLSFQDAVGLPLVIAVEADTQEVRNWKDALASVAEPGSKRHDWGFAASVEVLWAGDLNRDEQLDLLLKQGDAEIGSSIELFMSNGTRAMPRLILVDRFASGAC
jgi:hypothetical protein